MPGDPMPAQERADHHRSRRASILYEGQPAHRYGEEVPGSSSPAKEGYDVQTAAVGITGPYLIKGCDLPADIPPAVADLAAYFKSDATNSPALEFLSPIKGPALDLADHGTSRLRHFEPPPMPARSR